MAWSVKRMGDTRREREAKVRRTFGPLRKMVADLRADQIDAIKGVPVLHAWDEWMDIGDALDGWHGCFSRIMPGENLDVFLRVGKRLKYGTPLTMDDVNALEEALDKCERKYRETPMPELKSAISTAQIAWELELRGKLG